MSTEIDGVYHVFGISREVEERSPDVDPTMRETVFTKAAAAELAGEWEGKGFQVQVYGQEGATDVLRKIVEALEAAGAPKELWAHFYDEAFRARDKWGKFLSERE